YPRRVYAEAIKRAGIRLLLPCANRSAGAFEPEGEAIRVGLDAVAGLPEALKQRLLDERSENGPYHNLADLKRRLKPGPEALAALTGAGALDFPGRTGRALGLEADLLARGGRQPPVAAQQGADAPRSPGELFAPDEAGGWSPPDDPPLQRRRDEWRTLGLVLGVALFSLFRRPEGAGRPGGAPLLPASPVHEHTRRPGAGCGLVATARLVFTEDARPVQFVTLEDEHGLTEVTLFAGTCRQVPYLSMGPYTATGVVEERFGAVTVTARRFERWGD